MILGFYVSFSLCWIGSLISGLIAAGTAIASGVAAKKAAKRQKKEQLAAEQREEERRRTSLLQDPSLQKQGYLNAGLNPSGLTPSANVVF